MIPMIMDGTVLAYRVRMGMSGRITIYQRVYQRSVRM
jgi:hypothetical protein